MCQLDTVKQMIESFWWQRGFIKLYLTLLIEDIVGL